MTDHAASAHRAAPFDRAALVDRAALADRAGIEAIKRAHPLAELVARFVPDLRPRGRWLMARCPFHDDRTPSFAVSLATETWMCFGAGCGLWGDQLDFLGYLRYGRSWSRTSGEMFPAVLAELGGAALPPLLAPLPVGWQDATRLRPIELTRETQLVLHAAARLYHTRLLESGEGVDSPLRYLRERGFTLRTIRAEGIGYAVGGQLDLALRGVGLYVTDAVEAGLLREREDGRFSEHLAGRVVFLDQDRSGRILHLIGRRFASWLSNEAPKYLGIGGVTKPLHGWARLDKRASSKPVFLVEGPPDRLTLLQWGHDALAVCGAHLKPHQAVELARLPRPIVIVPNNDPGRQGQAAGERWRMQIREAGLRVSHDPILTIQTLPPSAKDVNEFARDAHAARHFAERIGGHVAL